MSRSSTVIYSPSTTQAFPTRARSPYSSTPAYAERYPTARYSYDYVKASAFNILPMPSYYGGSGFRSLSTFALNNDRDTRSYLDSSLRDYSMNLSLMPSYGRLYNRPTFSSAGTSRYNLVPDRAIRDYERFKNYGSGGSYWHHASYWRQRRHSEWNRSLELSRSGYHYYVSRTR